MKRRAGHNLPVYIPQNNAGQLGADIQTIGLFKIVEIFDSIQGEGLNCGEPMTFVRFSRCNLACDFCDTPYNRVALEMHADELIANILRRKPKWVLWTGGEPFLQLTPYVCEKIHAAGILQTCETNGMLGKVEAMQYMDHVTISPKLFYDQPGNPIPADKVIAKEVVTAINEGILRLDEVRYLICDNNSTPFALPGDIHLKARALVFSPLMMDAEPSGAYMSGKGHNSPNGTVDPIAFKRALKLVWQYRAHGARLSVQTHKLVGVR